MAKRAASAPVASTPVASTPVASTPVASTPVASYVYQFASVAGSDIVSLTKRQKLQILMVQDSIDTLDVVTSRSKTVASFGMSQVSSARMASAITHAKTGQFTPLCRLLFTWFADSRIGAPSGNTREAFLNWASSISALKAEKVDKPKIVEQINRLLAGCAPIMELAYTLSTVDSKAIAPPAKQLQAA